LRPEPEITRVRRQLTLLNELGLRALPATELVRCISAFESIVTIESNGKKYRADRINEVLLANLKQGDTFLIEAIGTDAIQAIDRIARLLPLLIETDRGVSPNPRGKALE